MSQGAGFTETLKSEVIRNIQSINMDQSYISQAQMDQIIKQVNNDDKVFKEIERIQDLAQLLRYIRQRKASNIFFLEYFIIIKLLEKNAQSSQQNFNYYRNLLDDQSEEKMDVNLIESIEEATICLDNILNLRQEKEILYRTVLIDTFYKVTCGFLRLLVRFDYSNIEQRLVDNFRKTLSSINELLIFNQRINFKELVKINDLTYSYLKAQTYFEAELQKRVSNPRFESKDLIWQMFHAQFLSTNQMIEDLQLHEGQEYNTFLEFYQNSLVGNDLVVFLRQNCSRIYQDLDRFPDRHYYYILYYWQSLVELIQLEDTRYDPFLQLPYMYTMFNAKQESISKLIQKLLDQIDNGSEYAQRWFKQISNIKETQDIELSMDIQCCLMKAFTEKYPKNTKQIGEIISQHLVAFSNRIQSYIASMQNESVQFRIVQENILFLLKFNNDSQIEISEILFNYLKSTDKQMMLFQKINISFILKLQEFRDPKLLQVCMYFAITISSESPLSIQLFISLIQELIINTKNCINNAENQEDLLYHSQILLFYIKCITAACVSMDNLKKRLQLSSKAQSKILMQKLYESSLFYYHVGDNSGTALLNQLLMSLPFLRNLLGIVCSTAKDCPIDLSLSILLEITYLYFLLYWKVPQRKNLQITQVQSESLLLYEDFYRFTIQTCLRLMTENLLTPNIYNILNNMLLIAFGEQYQLVVINPIFRDAINITEIQFHDLDEMSLLMSPEFKFQVIYNKYFEIVFAILFEVCSEDLKFAKLFYLNMLKFQLKTQIQVVLTFQELLPKFIFYFRIEKDEEIITLMKECLIPILTVSADIAILKQIFEVMSIHESVLVKLDTKQSSEELERAFLIANIPWYAIPLFDDNQRLLDLVRISNLNLKSYKQAVLTILEIISSSIKFIKESNSGQDSKRILHFQGEGSHVSTRMKKLTKAFQIRMKFQLSPLSTNQTFQTQDDAQGISASFMSDISGIQNCTFIQETEEVQIMQMKAVDCIQVFIGRGQQNQIIIKITQKISQEAFYRYNIPNQIVINQPHQLYIEFKFNTIQVSLDNQQLTCSNYAAINVSINFEQLCEITLGNNLTSGITQNQDVKQMTKSFINIDFAPDSSSFTGQIQEFQIVDKSVDTQKHLKLLELDLQQLDQRMQQKLHKSKFVNSMFQVEQTEQSYFKQGDLISSSNVYIIDNFALIELLLNNGHCNIFFLLMEIVCSINHDEINDQIIQVIIEITANLINNGQKVDIIQRQFIEEGSRSFELTLNQHIYASRGLSEGLLDKLIQLTKVINKIEFSNIVLNLISKYDYDSAILPKISVNFDKQLNLYFSTFDENKLIPNLLMGKFNIKLIPHISLKLATGILGLNNLKQQFQFISSLQPLNDDKIITNVAPKIKITIIKSIIIGLKQKQITFLTLDILFIFKSIIEDNPKDIFGQLLECKAIQFSDFILIINNFTDSNIKLLMVEIKNDPSYYSDLFFYLNIFIAINFIQYVQGLKQKNECLNNLKFTQSHTCQIREKTIKYIINIFLKLDNSQQQLKDFILQLIIDFYQQKFLDEKTKDLITTEIANDLRKELNIENIEKVNLRYFMQTPLGSNFFIQIIPSQIINLNQSQNIIQPKKRNQALEIFTYIITFIIEDPNYCSTKCLNKYFSLYPGIFNKDLFQIYLSILVQTAIQYAIPFKDQQTESSPQKEVIQPPAKFRNFIIALLQFELCIGQDIDVDRIQWNYYHRLIEITITLLFNFNMLFQKFDYIPSFRQKIEFVNAQDQIMPNGGLFRLMLNLILPYVHIEYQNIKMISLLNTLIEKYQEYQNKKMVQRPAYKFTPLIRNQSTKIQDVIPKQQEQDPFQRYFYDIILFQLLNTMNQEEQSINPIKEFILKYQVNFSQVIETVIANSQIDLDNEIDEFQNRSIGMMIETFHNKSIQFERAIKQQNRNLNKEQYSPLPKSLQEILNNYQFYQQENSNRFLNIIYNYAYGPYIFTNTLWLFSSRVLPEDKQRDNQSKSEEQVSVRTYSSLDTQVQEQSQDQLWAKQAFELKLKNSLLYFLDNNLKALYTELDDFLLTKEFDFQVLSQVQVKYKIKSLEDGLRRRGQLKQFKGKDKPYIQQNKTFSVINGTVIQGKSKNNPLESQSLSQSYTNTNVSPTLSRSNMQSDSTVLSMRKLSDTDDRVKIEAFDCECEMITQEGSIYGKFTVYKKSKTIVFTVEEARVDKFFECLDKLANPPFKELVLKDINRIMSRRYFLQEIALEIFCQNKSYFFNFFVIAQINKALDYCKEIFYCISDRRNEFKKQNFQTLWQKGKISNFEYLMLVNTYSGRTYNDLGQYFVFPWIISDYSSHRFELSNQNKYRDLRMPIGIIDNQRKDQLQQRKEFMKDAPREEYMHHGSHYSNSTIVMNYLLRLEPFNDLHYTLQKNRFDVADRLFSSIQSLWESSKLQDCKELIPEFYYMPEFLQNINSFDFGKMQSNIQVNDVDMPRWVKTRTAEEFVYIMRAALEGDITSLNLANWINLIFGSHSIGKKAEESNNLFYYLTYESSMNEITANIKTLSQQEKESKLAQIALYGQVPYQLFTQDHEKKYKSKLSYFYQMPNFRYKTQIYDQKADSRKLDTCTIISIYFQSEANLYLLYSNFMMLCFGENKAIGYTIATANKYKSPKRIQFEPVPPNFNQQNLFCYINRVNNFEERRFFDNVDSQYHSNVHIGTEETYFAITGYSDSKIEIWNLKKGSIEFTMNYKAKKYTCIKYHSYCRLLAVGSVDSCIYLWEVTFQNKLEIKSNIPKLIITNHKSAISCLDISDIYLLSVDTNLIGMVHTTTGNLLHQLNFNCESIITQCHIHPSQFFIFKCKKSILNVYTYNCSPYITNFELNTNNSFNLVFLTPFSSVFFVPSEESSSLYTYDIFDIKCQQQSFTYNQKTLKTETQLDKIQYERKLPEGVVLPDYSKKAPTALHVMLYDYEISENKHPEPLALNYILFFSQNGELFWLQEESQSNIIDIGRKGSLDVTPTSFVRNILQADDRLSYY